jgi:hypothetical protein
MMVTSHTPSSIAALAGWYLLCALATFILALLCVAILSLVPVATQPDLQSRLASIALVALPLFIAVLTFVWTQYFHPFVNQLRRVNAQPHTNDALPQGHATHRQEGPPISDGALTLPHQKPRKVDPRVLDIMIFLLREHEEFLTDALKGFKPRHLHRRDDEIAKELLSLDEPVFADLYFALLSVNTLRSLHDQSGTRSRPKLIRSHYRMRRRNRRSK